MCMCRIVCPRRQMIKLLSNFPLGLPTDCLCPDHIMDFVDFRGFDPEVDEQILNSGKRARRETGRGRQ